MDVSFVSLLEQWKPYHRYMVSSYGRVYSNVSDRFIKPTIDNRGYLKVSLCVGGVVKDVRVHRLVAELFLGDVKDYEVNHRNEDKLCNYVLNLELCTTSYNLSYGTRMKRSAISRQRRVAQYRKDNSLIRIFNSIKEATDCGYSHGNIIQCCRGHRKYAYNSKWRYYGSK